MSLAVDVPDGWPEMYSAAGRSAQCSHQMHWDSTTGFYRCIYECGVVDVVPDRDAVQDGAILSNDREYRYRLWRVWDPSEPILPWIMLNPSTADETEDDHTISCCVRFAEDWGYGGIMVGNLFALRATDPSEIRDHPEPIGPENDAHLEAITQEADTVLAAWGTNGDLYDRDQEVVEMLDPAFSVLDTTKHGHPNHPLRMNSDLEPSPFDFDE